MTTYFEYHVNLSDGQKANLAKAIESSSEITLRVKNNQLRGNDELMLTKTQIQKIEKAARNKTGVDIKISKNEIRKSVKHGGSFGFRVFCLWGQGFSQLLQNLWQKVHFLLWGVLE